MKKFFEEISHYAVIIAIPFWVIAYWYFLDIDERTPTENILLIFTGLGLVMNILFSFIWVFRSK